MHLICNLLRVQIVFPFIQNHLPACDLISHLRPILQQQIFTKKSFTDKNLIVFEIQLSQNNNRTQTLLEYILVQSHSKNVRQFLESEKSPVCLSK